MFCVLPRMAALAAVLLLTMVPQTMAAPLSLDEALRLAERRSQQLPAQRAAAEAARQMAVAAGQRPDPVLKAGVDNLPVNGRDRFSVTNDFMTMRSVGLMQEWTRSDKLAARAQKFEREAQVAEAGQRLALANLQRDTAIAWLDRHYLQRMRELAQQQREEAQLLVQAAEASYRGGRGTQADAFAARSTVAQTDDKLAVIERDLASATTMLVRWVGPAGSEPLATPPDMQNTLRDDDDLDAALSHHPAIALMIRREAAARAEAEAARANQKPDVTVELTYSQRGAAYSNMVSLGISIPLPWDRSQRQDRELAARLAMAEQLRADREEETRAHLAELRVLQHRWRSNRERLRRYDDELLPLAIERTRAVLVAYRGNSAPLSAALDARRAEIDTRMDRLRLEMETARAWAEFNYLVPADHTAPEYTR